MRRCLSSATPARRPSGVAIPPSRSTSAARFCTSSATAGPFLRAMSESGYFASQRSCESMIAASTQPNCSKRIQERRHAEVEHVGEAVGVLPRDHVAVGRELHRFEQRDRRLVPHVLLGRVAKPAGVGECGWLRRPFVRREPSSF